MISQLDCNLQKNRATTLYSSSPFTIQVLFTIMFGVELELNTFLMNEWISKMERIRKEEYLNMNLSSKEGEKIGWKKQTSICWVCTRHHAKNWTFFPNFYKTYVLSNCIFVYEETHISILAALFLLQVIILEIRIWPIPSAIKLS